MINEIYSESNFQILHRDVVEENGVCVILDNEFYDETNRLKNDLIANLSVDTFYNALGLISTPPSPDNLIVIKRGENKFSIYIVELKCVAKMRSIKVDNIRRKFDTAINDFMKTRFNHVFNKEGTKLVDLSLWLVCNRFNFIGSDISEENYLKRIKGSAMESILLTKPYSFRNKLVRIELMLSGKEII